MSMEDEVKSIRISPDEDLAGLLAEGRGRVAKALARIRRPQARVGTIDSPVGRLFVAEGEHGILAIHFLDTHAGEDPRPALRRGFDVIEDQQAAERIGEEIRRFIGGDRSALHHEVDLSLVDSPFRRRALIRLRQVPIGSVVTYQSLAAAIGAPDAQRAVGSTMATNPVPIYVPCHRVIRSDGTIGNYGGGVERKIRLLRAEGFEVGQDLRLPAGAVFGHQRTHIFCRPTCSAAKRADRGRMVIFADPDKARRAGLRACKLCHPA